MILCKKRPLPVFEAKDLDEAYSLGYFSGSMSRYKFLSLLKKNRDIHFKTKGSYASLYSGKEFICGMSPHFTIPRYSITKLDRSKLKKIGWSTPDGKIYSEEMVNKDDEHGKVFVRGWEQTLRVVRQKGYHVNEQVI